VFLAIKPMYLYLTCQCFYLTMIKTNWLNKTNKNLRKLFKNLPYSDLQYGIVIVRG
jgi:hypothetical protein